MNSPIARIVFPFATPSLNQWQRWHWARKRQFVETCRMVIRADLGKSQSAGPAPFSRVVLRRYSLGTLDDDNLRGGAKGLLDAIVRERLLQDDSPKCCAVEYEQHKARRGDSRTEVEVFSS